MPGKKLTFPKFHREMYKTLDAANRAQSRLSSQYECTVIRFYHGEIDREAFQSERLRTKSYMWMIKLENEK